jgi:two-component sensor histidine kinase
LVTELVSAAFEHFGADQHGAIHVALHRGAEEQLVLDVSDNARRSPDASDALSWGPRARIVGALVAQLGGGLEREQGDGTKVRVAMRFAGSRKAGAGRH